MGTKQLALIVAVLVFAIAAYLVLRSLGDGDSDPGQPPPTGQDGTPVPALVGPTKQGDIYALDRRTREPIIPVREEPAAGGAIPEDFTSPTQPVSGLTFMPDPLEEKDMWGIALFDQLACRIKFHQHLYSTSISTKDATRRRPCEAPSSIPAISARSTGAAWLSIRSGG